MNPLLLGAFIGMLLAGAFQYVLAIRYIEPVLPLQFKGTPQSAYAMDTHVWSSQVPEIARRRYVRSFGLLAGALAALTLREFLANGLSGRVVVGCAFTAASSWLFAARWLKHRALRRAN